MKYHYRIIDERYPDEVQCTSATWVTHTADSTPDNPIKGPFIGFDTKEEAWKAGKEEHTMLHMEDYCTIEVYPVAENDEMVIPYDQGQDAWFSNQSLEDNPYKIGTTDHYMWNTGYGDAEWEYRYKTGR